MIDTKHNSINYIADLNRNRAQSILAKQTEFFHKPLQIPSGDENIARIVSIYKKLEIIHDEFLKPINDIHEIIQGVVEGDIMSFTAHQYYNLLFLINFTLDILENYHLRDKEFVVAFSSKIESLYSKMVKSVISESFNFSEKHDLLSIA